MPDPERLRDEREGVRPNYDRPEAAVTYGNVHYKIEDKERPVMAGAHTILD